MSITESGMQQEDVLVPGDADVSQTDLEPVTEGAPSEGAAPQITDHAQTDSEAPAKPPQQNAAAKRRNQSGDTRAKRSDENPLYVPSRVMIDSPVPDTEILAIGKELGVQTESDVARDQFLDIIESLKTGRYLTDKIVGVEKHSSGGEPRAVLFHGEYKIIIMASMLLDLPNDLRGLEPNAVYHYLLTKRIGAEIDYVIKGIDQDSGIAVGNRKEAMATKRRFYFVTPTKEGPHRIYKGTCCEARVMSVIPEGIYVELFGIDVYIPLRELSHNRIPSAMGHYEPGDRVLVKVIKLNREDPDHIRVAVSVKQLTANPIDKAIDKIEVGNSYAGTVTMADSTGIFVYLDMGADCRCRYPLRSRPPKGARVIVKIAGINAALRYIWGNIVYVSIPK